MVDDFKNQFLVEKSGYGARKDKSVSQEMDYQSDRACNQWTEGGDEALEKLEWRLLGGGSLTISWQYTDY
jgi:hypothetical protein